jgi:hypothetical protein
VGKQARDHIGRLKRPAPTLQYWFLVITDRHTGAIVSSNLDDPQGPGLWLDGIRQRLAAFGVTPPAGLWNDLAVDRHADAGTRCARYDEDVFAGPEPSGMC